MCNNTITVDIPLILGSFAVEGPIQGHVQSQYYQPLYEALPHMIVCKISLIIII